MNEHIFPDRPPSPTLSSGITGKLTFDGKRMRKAVVRRTIDYNSAMIHMLTESNYHAFKNDYKSYSPIQPDQNYIINILPPSCYTHNISYSICTKFIHASTNKIRCPVNMIKWTPEGRRLITGSQSGEFTLWNGLTFNFETITQAHEQAIRSMTWSHNGNFLISGDHIGTIKYWQPNLNNVQSFQAHNDPVRDLSFSPTDTKFASCSDDGVIKVWDFFESKEEQILRGHNWDVKNVQWHPIYSLLASGSKDNTIKLWDPRTSKNLATIHGHKNTVLDLKWNMNGKWLLTCGKDQLIKMYDIRKLVELQSFKGHKKDVTSLSWHPFHENFFVSGGYEGSMVYWNILQDSPLAMVENAHDAAIWSMDWHPVGHILVSGSNDHSTKFWSRSRPNDLLEEKDSKLSSSIIETNAVHSNALYSKQEDEDEDFLPGFDRKDDFQSRSYNPPHNITTSSQVPFVKHTNQPYFNANGFPANISNPSQHQFQRPSPSYGKQSYSNPGSFQSQRHSERGGGRGRGRGGSFSRGKIV